MAVPRSQVMKGVEVLDGFTNQIFDRKREKAGVNSQQVPQHLCSEHCSLRVDTWGKPVFSPGKIAGDDRHFSGLVQSSQYSRERMVVQGVQAAFSHR